MLRGLCRQAHHRPRSSAGVRQTSSNAGPPPGTGGCECKVATGHQGTGAQPAEGAQPQLCPAAREPLRLPRLRAPRHAPQPQPQGCGLWWSLGTRAPARRRARSSVPARRAPPLMPSTLPGGTFWRGPGGTVWRGLWRGFVETQKRPWRGSGWTHGFSAPGNSAVPLLQV